MEQLSLLEKLKTLNQWQLQQQLRFAKLQSDIDNGIDNGANRSDRVESDSFANKENWISVNENKVDAFTRTMGRNALTKALRSIDLNSSTNEIQSEEPVEVNDKDVESEESLQNLHLSGLQTVKFASSFNGNANKENYGQVTSSQDTDSEGFSDGEILNFDTDDGVKPFSETDDEELIEPYKRSTGTRLHQPDQENGIDFKLSTKGFQPPSARRIDEPAFSDQFSDGDDESNEDEEDDYDNEKETTVLHIHDVADDNAVEEQVNIDDKPVRSKLNDSGLTFEKMIEEEIKNDVESALNTSTPMKKKKHRFLKRGEGLKRFERGNNAHIPKKEKPNVKKTQPIQRKNLKSTAFDIKPPSPTQQQKPVRIKPGLPLKLNLKRLKSNKMSSPNVVAKEMQNAPTEEITEPSVSLDKQAVRSTSTLEQYPNHDLINPKYFSATDKPDVQQSVSSSILEASFQKMMSHYREKEEKENKELDDFEALEEAAENMSLSSNSSLVVKLLGKKKVDGTEKRNQLDKITEKQSWSQEDCTTEVTVKRPPSYDFEDELSWSDNGNSDTSIFSIEENEETIIRDESPSPDMPPMKRIVSKKKDGEQSKILSQESFCDTTEGTKDDVQQPAISLTVKNKLAELENEIKTFRLENEKLEKLRHERETEVSRLRKEIQTFQNERRAETERFDSYKNEETKKLKAEKKAFDKYQKAARNFPNKQEREELKELKEEIQNLKEELKTRETRWNSASHRFRTRITDLEEENKELRQEIKVFEEERLGRWKREKSEKNPTAPKGSLPDASNTNEDPSKEFHLTMSPPVPLSKLEEPHQRSIQSLSPRSPLEHPPSKNEALKSPTYKQEISSAGEVRHKDGKTEVVMPDNSKIITFPNGTKKTISPDGKVVSVCFFNGDIKRLLPDDVVVYYYAKTQTTHTTHPDGLEILEFSNKQIEKRHPDGKTEVIFPDQTVKYLHPDSSEETVFTDGTVQNINTTGVRTIVFPNGQRETHTKQFKRREYPNGTVKTVYEDGRQETKYSNGRLRVKDKHGNLLIDSGINQT